MRKSNTTPREYVRKFPVQENGQTISVFCRGVGWTISKSECEEATKQIRARGVTAFARGYIVRNKQVYILFVEDPIPKGIATFVLGLPSNFTQPKM